MALRKINVGTNPDGTTRWQYVQEDSDLPVIITGPVTGTVQTADGTTYDVTADVIEVKKTEHGGEIAHAIGEKLEEEGHPKHTAEDPFVHLCTDACGGLKRADDHPKQVEALARAKAHVEGLEHDPATKAHVAEALGVTKRKASR